MKRPTAIPLLCALLLALPAGASQTSFNNSLGQISVGWQDSEGKPQQLTYRLEQGKLPPLIAYRPARMQEEVLQSFAGYGFAPMQPRFALRDVLQGRSVVLSDGHSGTAQGVGEDGALWVLTDSGMQPVTSSEVSVRPASLAATLSARPTIAPGISSRAG